MNGHHANRLSKRLCSLAIAVNTLGLVVIFGLGVWAEVANHYAVGRITEIDRANAFNIQQLHQSFPQFDKNLRYDLALWITAPIFNYLKVVLGVSFLTLGISTGFLIRHRSHLEKATVPGTTSNPPRIP